MNTEESKVKEGVKKFLHARGVMPITKPIDSPNGYYHMPVPSGYGSTTLDFIGHYKGFFFAIETKRLGDSPTPRQDIIMDAITRSGGHAIWGDSAESIIRQMEAFMSEVDRDEYQRG